MVREKYTFVLPKMGFFTGGNTCGGTHEAMRYRIRHVDENFEVSIWPQPWAYEKTDPALIEACTFPYEVASLEKISAYLGERYERFAKQVKSGEIVLPSVFDAPYSPPPAEEDGKTEEGTK